MDAHLQAHGGAPVRSQVDLGVHRPTLPVVGLGDVRVLVEDRDVVVLGAGEVAREAEVGEGRLRLGLAEVDREVTRLGELMHGRELVDDVTRVQQGVGEGGSK